MCGVTGAIIGGVATLGGAAIASSGARDAARAQQQGVDASVEEQRRQYDLTRQDMEPWRQAGINALARLQDPNAFTSDPGYQYALDQSQQAIERSAAARGGLASGNTLTALQRNAIGLADQNYGNWWNRQAGLAGVGQSATNQLAGFGAQTSANIGNAFMTGGNARASGIANSSNAWGNAFGTIGGIAQNYYQNRQDQQNYNRLLDMLGKTL